MRPGSLAASIVLVLSLINGAAYLSTRRETASPSVTPPGADPGAVQAPVPAPPVNECAPQEASGLLLVTTTPRGVLVEVDGEGRDLSPARVPLPAGRHQVVLREGARVLLDEAVEIRRGSTSVILHALGVPPPGPVEESVATVQATP